MRGTEKIQAFCAKMITVTGPLAWIWMPLHDPFASHEAQSLMGSGRTVVGDRG
jgi:hypothetical protein